MKTVSLICTVHAEAGRANASELLAILKHIRPEVAFLEVPADWGREKIANHKSLESDALLRYQETHSLALVPVDAPTPPASFFRDSEQIFNYIERASYKYCQLADANQANIAAEGFLYLNSELQENIQSELHSEVLRILEMRRDPSLTRAYEKWCHQNDLRDIEMISNIESYGRENKFDRAVFLVGAAHRPSILKKSRERSLVGLSEVQWSYSTDWSK